MHEVLRRSIFILSITVLLLGGCASKQSKQNSNASIEPPSLIVVVTSETHWTNAHWPIGCGIAKLDNQIEIGQVSKIPPGKHFISIKIIWSNFYEEEISFTVDIASNKRYEIYALEVDKENAENVKIHPLTTGEHVSHWILFPIKYTAAYLFAPVTLGRAFYAVAAPPKNRPARKEGFVWIEDAETHQIIAGIKPSNDDNNLDEE